MAWHEEGAAQVRGGAIKYLTDLHQLVVGDDSDVHYYFPNLVHAAVSSKVKRNVHSQSFKTRSRGGDDMSLI